MSSRGTRGPVWIARHYGTLWYFARHRFREGEYSRMRRYFAQLLAEYHTRLHWTTKIPVLREVLTQSVTYLLGNRE